MRKLMDNTLPRLAQFKSIFSIEIIGMLLNFKSFPYGMSVEKMIRG